MRYQRAIFRHCVLSQDSILSCCFFALCCVILPRISLGLCSTIFCLPAGAGLLQQMQDLGDRSGLGAPATQYVGVPMNQQMDRFGEATLIQQEFELLEIFGVEAKQRYRVYPVSKEATAPGQFQSMYIREVTWIFFCHCYTGYLLDNLYLGVFINQESECLERVCCGPCRTLTLKVHFGADRNAPLMLNMHKPFHCQCCCFFRPTMFITDGAEQNLGRVTDPCNWNCMLDQVENEGSSLHFIYDGNS
jgi:hypothetical protein